MPVVLTLKRPDDLYFCWKKAIDEVYLHTRNLKKAKKHVEVTYGVKTVKMIYDETNLLVGLMQVVVEFESEAHVTWFKLKFS